MDTDDGDTLPPPADTTNTTGAPGLGLLNRSVTSTRTESIVVAAIDVVTSAPILASAAAASAWAFTENSIGEPVSDAEAETDCVPGVVPSVQYTAATPSRPDVADDALIAPPPAVTANETMAPAYGEPCASLTFTPIESAWPTASAPATSRNRLIVVGFGASVVDLHAMAASTIAMVTRCHRTPTCEPSVTEDPSEA